MEYLSFKFMKSMKESVEDLPEEERSKMLRCYMIYGTTGSSDGIPVEYYPLISSIKPSIDKSQQRYAEKIARRAGKKAVDALQKAQDDMETAMELRRYGGGRR